MRTTIWASVAVCVAVSVAAGELQAAETENDSSRPGWFSNLEDGRAEALRTGKPLMVVLRCEP